MNERENQRSLMSSFQSQGNRFPLKVTKQSPVRQEGRNTRDQIKEHGRGTYSLTPFSSLVPFQPGIPVHVSHPIASMGFLS